ncbi:MAG: SH3 domain-containing protein [Niabella sp.]
MKKYILSAGLALLSVLAMAQKTKLIAERSGKNAVIVHEVQPKEGLYTLSRIYGVSVSDIAGANGFDRDKGLSIGQKVKIPLTSENLSQQKGKTPVYYTVASGESLAGISNRFNKVPVKDLKSWNKIGGNKVTDGKEIIVGYFAGTLPGKTAADPEAENAAAKTNVKAVNARQAIITGTHINIRKGPATDQEVVGTVQQDEIVTVLKKVNNEWSAVRTKDGVEGYMASRFLQQAETKEAPKKAAAIKTARISGTNINIRKGPAMDQDVVGVAQQDDVVEIIKNVNNEWTSIRLKDGTEGFIATRFLGAGGQKAEPERTGPPVKKATVSGSNINIRKGPATDQEVVTRAQQYDVVTIVKKVDNEWSQVRLEDGTEGFIATRFLADGVVEKPEVDNTQVAKAREEKVDNVVEKISKKVAEKESAETAVATPVASDAGYFKNDYDKNTNPNLAAEATVTSGIFKTDRGWSDGRYYMLMDNAAPGTIVKITNPENNKTVYAKVLGKMKNVPYSDNFDIRISEAAAAKLQTNHPDNFTVKVTY